MTARERVVLFMASALIVLPVLSFMALSDDGGYSTAPGEIPWDFVVVATLQQITPSLTLIGLLLIAGLVFRRGLAWRVSSR